MPPLQFDVGTADIGDPVIAGWTGLHTFLSRKLLHGYNVRSVAIVAQAQARLARCTILGFARSCEDATVKRAIRPLRL